MPERKTLILFDEITFLRAETDLILEALYFFESEKTFESEEDYIEWRNTLKKVEELIKERSEA